MGHKNPYVFGRGKSRRTFFVGSVALDEQTSLPGRKSQPSGPEFGLHRSVLNSRRLSTRKSDDSRTVNRLLCGSSAGDS